MPLPRVVLPAPVSALRTTAAAVSLAAICAGTLLFVPTAAASEPDAPTGVVLNEIIYDEVPTGFADTVEVYNAGDVPVDVTGWRMSDDKRDRFGDLPATVLAPGEFLVLTADINFSFGLGKNDEVVLYDASGAEVDAFAYDNTAPLSTWARCGDGTGEWAHATEATPGAANNCVASVVEGSIRINEVDSQPSDWIEFYNPGDTTFDISGYEIRDNSDDHRWQFLPGSTIEPGAYLVVEESSIGLVDGVEAAFREPIGIGSADRIRLFDTTGTLVDDTLPWQRHAAIDGDYGAATFARCPDGVGPFLIGYATPGAANSCVMPDVVINEVESNGDATDWVEIFNNGATDVDISGWTVIDNDPFGHATETTPLPEGTTIDAGAYFVFDQPDNFIFGLGGKDTATVRDANGNTVDEFSWTAHADGVWARCADGVGGFVDLAVSTKGMRNACGNPVRINEVESNGGSPDDWIELVNPTTGTLDVSGLVVKDNDDTHEYVIPQGSSIDAGGYLVIEAAQLGFGLGKDDSVRVFDGDLMVDDTSWTSHAATTWGRCPDMTGPFAVTAEPTKGATNVCVGEVAVGPWPGSAEVRVVDTQPMFLEDSSGLDVQETADGVVLWGIDNGEGRIWKMDAAADGSVTYADGWESGKRVRFQHDADNPRAAGPDTEGITVDDQGNLFIASERDNSAKGVNFNVVLKVNPDAADGDIVAEQEWDLTELLPAVGANLGIEAAEWVCDDVLAGVLFDQSTGGPYNPADYAAHGNGLVFVAMEDNGHVYAFALHNDGSASLVSEIDPGLAGVMALDYDSVLGVLWAVCDDGCQGRSAQITLNGTDSPDVALFARPAGMPDINNEGFATAPASLAVDGQRPVWWFADGFASESLRTGTLPAGETEGPGGGTDPERPGEGGPGTGGSPGGADDSPDAPGGGLATTGGAIPMIALGTGVLMLGIGLVLARMRRRSGAVTPADEH